MVQLEDEAAQAGHTGDEDVEHCNQLLTVVRTPQMNREVQRELRTDIDVRSRADELEYLNIRTSVAVGRRLIRGSGRQLSEEIAFLQQQQRHCKDHLLRRIGFGKFVLESK